LLGFRCERTIESGIQEIYAAIRSGQLADFTTSQFNNQIAIRAVVQAAGSEHSSLRQLAALVRVEGRPL
jgi:hypothetical protein